MELLATIFTPLLCALIGWSTNWLAIRMLFRPHRAVYIGRLRVPFTPGLIPKEQAKLSKKIAETVSRHVLTPDVLARELAVLAKAAVNPSDLDISAHVPRLTEWIETGLNDNPKLRAWLIDLLKKLIDQHVGRLAGLFLDADKIYESIKDGLLEYLQDPDNQTLWLQKADTTLHTQAFEQMLENVVTHIAQHIPIQAMIEKKLNALAVEESERIILSVVKRELGMITALGGVLGFVIGLLSLLV
jgi:hypothetical protein